MSSNGLRFTAKQLKELGFDENGDMVLKELIKKKKPQHSEFQVKNVYRNDNFIHSTLKHKDKP